MIQNVNFKQKSLDLYEKHKKNIILIIRFKTVRFCEKSQIKQ